jgi:hypothetical protein
VALFFLLRAKRLRPLPGFSDFRVTDLVVRLSFSNSGPFIGRDSKVALRTPDRAGKIVTLQIFHYCDTPKNRALILPRMSLSPQGTKVEYTVVQLASPLDCERCFSVVAA